MRVMVADDEMLARETLILILKEIQSHDMDITEARNGEELVRLASELQPDVAFVDIRMPGMSGLEAMQELLTRTPSTRWIVMTGFAEFDYARQALQLGALDYLLKPVEPDDVSQIIRRAAEQISQERQSAIRKFEWSVTSLWHQREPLKEEPSTVLLDGGMWHGFLLFDDGPLSPPDAALTENAMNDVEGIHDWSLNLQAAWEAEHGSGELLHGRIRLGPGEYAWIMKVPEHKTETRVRQLPDWLAARMAGSSPVTMVASGKHGSFSSLREELHELQALSYLRNIAGKDGRLRADDLRALAAQPAAVRLGESADRMLKAYARGDYVQFTSNWDRLKPLLHREAPDGDVLAERLTACLYSRLSEAAGLPAEAGGDPVRLLELLAGKAGELLLRKKADGDPGGKDWLRKAVRYVECHYCGDITVSGVAERFDVSPNHFSTLFHKKMDVTFIQYVTRLRMMKAKELLSVSGMKVNEAAEQVGYYSSRHFTNLFKAYAGCCPSDYVKKLQTR